MKIAEPASFRVEAINERQSFLTTLRLWIAILAVLSCSFCLNVVNNDFPLGYHFDEPKKVRFVLTGEQDFHHPILMLELVRWANQGVINRTPQEVVELGRTVMAVVGALIPVVMVLIAIPYLGRLGSVVVGGTLAVVPTMVLHSHYLKEDILLVLLSWVAMGGFSGFWRTHKVGWLLLAGLGCGLAMGSHYKGLLVGIVGLCGLLMDSALTRWQRGAMAALVSGLALLGFLLPNAVIFEQMDVFVSGLNHERSHALFGHFVPIYASDFFLTYHLRYSVLPGLTYGLGITAVGSLAWWTIRMQRLQSGERVWLAFVWVSYLVPEISPLKPNPDEARYILPMIPGLVYFWVKSLQLLLASEWPVGTSRSSDGVVTFWNIKCWRTSVVLVAGLLVFGAAFDTVKLNHYLIRDTRAELVRWAEAEGIQLTGEPMTGTENRTPYVYDSNLDTLRRSGYTHFVISSFCYDPYLVTAHLTGQTTVVQARRAAYLSVLERGTVRFQPKHRSFGFSNPTLVVVDLSEMSKHSKASAGQPFREEMEFDEN